MEIRRLLDEKRDEILRIADAHHVRNLRLFGSVARGESDEQSDIDFLAELDSGCGLLHHAALIRELEELLGRKVDVVSDKGLRQRVRDRVLREAVPL
ncbi:MAG: nucleotidyltransferase family protein [Armatimonadota bacterium]|nr:nucleotidyltransferase family protein [Armatimonadota bacterium]